MGRSYEEYLAAASHELSARDRGCVEALNGAAAQLWADDEPRQEGERPHANSEYVWRGGRLDADELGGDGIEEAGDADDAGGVFDGPARPAEGGPGPQPLTAAERESLHRDPEYRRAAAEAHEDAVAWQEAQWIAGGELPGPDPDSPYARAAAAKQWAEGEHQPRLRGTER